MQLQGTRRWSAWTIHPRRAGLRAVFVPLVAAVCLSVLALPCAPASAEGAGSISGTVRNGRGYGSSGAVITLYDADGTALATTMSGTLGAYQFSAVELGTYRVGFFSPDVWTLCAPQFYDHAVTLADAAPIVLSASVTSFAGADGSLELAGYRGPTSARGDGSWKTEQHLYCPGTNAALSGDTVAAGFNGTRGNVNASGGVSICRRDARGWSLRQMIDSPAPVEYGVFGRRLALDDDTLTISQYTSEKWLEEPGRVFLYSLSGSTWRLRQELVASGTKLARQAFGDAVAVAGDTVFVGASYAHVRGAQDAGAVFVFKRHGDAWSKVQTLTAGPQTVPDAHFGSTLATDGVSLFVGAPEETTSAGLETGAVHVFTLRDGRWEPGATMFTDGARTGDHFGSALALSGDTLLAAARGKDDWGQVQVFTRTDTGWVFQDQLVRPDGIGDFFGDSLALSGDKALVGWPLLRDGGCAYYYVRANAKWRSVAALGAAEQTGQMSVGHSVGISGRDLLVFSGLDGDSDDGSPSSDVARVYRPYVTAAGTQLTVDASDGVLLNDTPPAGETATAQPATQPEHGEVTLAPDGSFTYTPIAGFAGTDTFQYQAVSATWTSLPATVTVSVEDMQAPTIGIDGVAKGWFNTPVTVELSPNQEKGVTRLDYRRIDRTQWLRYVGPITVHAQGATSYRVRASDTVGAVRGGAGFTVKLDTQRPRTLAPQAATGTARRLDLRYEVRDPRPGSPTANVTIDFFKGRAYAGALILPHQRVNRLLTTHAACGLKTGTYRFVVWATDAAGNRQRAAGSNRLTVR